MTNQSSETPRTGKIAGINGPVVDVSFEKGRLPRIREELWVLVENEKRVMEVSQHIGGGLVRCIMLGASEGLFRGMEVTTGGQRIHDYAMQVEKMERLHMDVADFESYLLAHKNGLPPHGGLGIGLERLTMKLIGENNIREATLFPRDINRLIP